MSEGAPGDRERLAMWVAHELDKGRPNAEIEADLCRMGATPDQATQYVKAVRKGVKKVRDREESKHALKVLLYIVVVFGGINALLWFGQEAMSKGHRERAAQLRPQVTALQQEVRTLDLKLDSAQEASQRIDSLEYVLGQPYNFPTTRSFLIARDRYDSLVTDWNAKLPGLHVLATERNLLAAQHDSLVDLLNRANRRASSKWLLLPIPRSGP